MKTSIKRSRQKNLNAVIQRSDQNLKEMEAEIESFLGDLTTPIKDNFGDLLDEKIAEYALLADAIETLKFKRKHRGL